MFKFLKRFAAPEPRPERRRAPVRKRSAADPIAGPAALPEVTEGNEDTDWELWEDSMTTLNSQMQSLGPSSRFSDLRGQSSSFDDSDAFARVSRKDD